MATTLYAPQVPAVQPAFVYNSDSGEVNVNFSFSAFNTAIDITDVQIKIVDPNESSADGKNVVLDWSYITSFENNMAKCICKTLKTNQYYQVQLRFANVDIGAISDPSQVTLIYPIDAYTNSNLIFNNTYYTYLEDRLSNKKIMDYEVECSNTEKIVSYRFIFTYIKDYSSSMFTTTSLKFSGSVDMDLPDGDFTVVFEFTTQHGYKGTEQLKFNGNNVILNYSVAESASLSKPYVDKIDNGIGGVIDFSISNNQGLQREVNDGIWKTIKYNVSGSDISFSVVPFQIRDNYRLISGNNVSPILTIESDYEDIFLSDKEILMAVRYNPSITSFKWIKQESVTNTLGGKYPIISVNANTDYRQFTFGGTLFCDNIGNLNLNTTDSKRNENEPMINMSNFFNPSYDLYCGDRALKALSKTAAETEARHILEAFLKNSQPKLFRSIEEGNMIVYLSNVSFTPNKQLGRHVWDFSATVTEMCDYTEDNLVRYKVTLGNLNPLTANNLIEDSEDSSVLMISGGN